MIVEVKIQKSRIGGAGQWYTVKNGTGSNATLQAQIERFDEKSMYGIKGGRISKLFVVENGAGWGNYLYYFDRGEQKHAANKEVQAFVDEIIRKYN